MAEPTVSVSVDSESEVEDALDELAVRVARLRVVLRLADAPVPTLAAVPAVPVGPAVTVLVALAELGGRIDEGTTVTDADPVEEAPEEDPEADALPPEMEKRPV